jgi:hypothetical protein
VTVVVTPGEQPRVRLTQLAFGVGVGWYAQHSVDLELSEAHNLAALLARAPRATEAVDAPPAPIALAEYRKRSPRRDPRRAAPPIDGADSGSPPRAKPAR